jgi:hypothetical protein
LKITYPDQVWATDITYIRMDGFFMYFVAIIDLLESPKFSGQITKDSHVLTG